MNIVKHAKADKARVSVRRVAGRIRVSVRDNGIGFDQNEITWMPARTGGFGLFSIRERLENVGGCLKIKSRSGRGCNVTVVAPLNRGKGPDHQDCGENK